MKFTPHFFDKLPSTQIFAKELIAQNRFSYGDVIVAAEQTQGYGRRGHVWQSPLGNLYATMILPLRELSDMTWMGFVTGLALYEAVTHFITSGDSLKIKWPNDLLLNGAKLAGLLVEIVDKNILVGFGVNLAFAPLADQPTACLVTSPLPADYLDYFIPAFARWYATGCEQGMEALHQPWLAYAGYQPQQELTARLPDGDIVTGRFIGLDFNGALILQAGEKTYSLTAADLFSNSEDDRK